MSEDIITDGKFKLDLPIKKHIIIDDVDLASEDWVEKFAAKYVRYKAKAEALDMLADHLDILHVLVNKQFNYVQMTKKEIETIADALGTCIQWENK